MPAPYKGRRVRVQARLPYDIAARAEALAAERRWSMSEFVNYCVEAEIQRTSHTPGRAPAKLPARKSPLRDTLRPVQGSRA